MRNSEATCGNAETPIRQNVPSSKPNSETRRVAVETVQELILTRCHTSPRRLVSPGPTSEQTDTLFTLAASAPDHVLLVPWRFMIIPTELRHQLADLQGHEHAVCCINIGTIDRVRPRSRRHPSLPEIVGVLGENSTMNGACPGS